MDTQEGHFSKRVRSVFLLDRSKLSRLLYVVESKFKVSGEINQQFQVTMQSGKDLSVNSLEHVLAQDNAVKNPINELSIKASTLDVPSKALVAYDRKNSEINIRVSSPDVKWASELFSEIEEQVERALVRSWVYAFKQWPFTLFMLLPLSLGLVGLPMALLTSPAPSQSTARRLLLTPQDVERLEAIAHSAETTEKRVAFLFEFHSAQLEAISQYDKTGRLIARLSSQWWPAALVALPIIIIIIAACYLFAKCYPGSAFDWGDYADHLKVLSERRRLLWSTILIALAIGVVANLAVYGVSQFMRP